MSWFVTRLVSASLFLSLRILKNVCLVLCSQLSLLVGRIPEAVFVRTNCALSKCSFFWKFTTLSNFLSVFQCQTSGLNFSNYFSQVALQFFLLVSSFWGLLFPTISWSCSCGFNFLQQLLYVSFFWSWHYSFFCISLFSSDNFLLNKRLAYLAWSELFQQFPEKAR